MTTAAAKPQSRQPTVAASRHRKEVTTMIKRITKALFALRQPVSYNHREFNGQLLERQREDVFVLLHQHVGGLR
ncbi:hypothetical protein [Arthrobacter sp. BE255]|jgi:hypothetical protein|uniref:hypothetical protein n=1 Tax=Arthrobacter sp. BE255 TaxID=2817721 RepID=UPI002855D71F|nr:hypothetical protein [Arthrobacter sp. BE255]MDR7158548.1 hypothetical protein [Arthrobacter sp. BE255]